MAMSNWQILLDTLTGVAEKLRAMPDSHDIEDFAEKLLRNRTIREILQKHIAEYEETFRHKTRKNPELAETLRRSAVREKAKGHANAAIEKYTRAQMLALQPIPGLASVGLAVKGNGMPPPPSINENTEFKCANTKLELCYTERDGRHVVAKEKILCGEVLFVEKPEACIVNEEFKLKFCHYCCVRVPDIVVCDSCNEVLFCSEQCREKNAPVHHFECGYLAFLQSVGVAHLGLRCLFAQLPGQSTRVEELKNLVFHNDNLEMDELFQYTVTAVLLTQYLETCTDYFKQCEETRVEICVIILKHILQLVVNAHAIIYACARPAEDDAIVSIVTSPRVATGIYPASAMMNHSCEPNIVNNFHGNTLVVRALRDIEANEEIYNCYGPHYARMRQADRKNVLFQQYNFECECAHCTSDQDTMEIYSAYLCPECGGPLIASEGEGSCRDCYKKFPITKEMTDGLAKANVALERAINEEDITLNGLIAGWKLARSVLYSCHETTCRLADETARRLAQCGSWGICYTVLACTLLTLKKRYGNISNVVASECLKISRAAEEAAKQYSATPILIKKFMAESKKYKEETEKLSLILYGCKEILDDIQL